jgi:hypothetical protein
MVTAPVAVISVLVPVMAPEVAVIVVVPGATMVAIPLVVIVATNELDEFHVTEVVRS